MPGVKPSSCRSISLAMGEIPAVIARTMIAILFMYYLTDLAGINVFAAGVIIMLARLWDAFLDPFSAALSDRMSRSPGRRRRSMLLSSLPMGLFFLVLWQPWDAGAPLLTMAIYAILLILFMSALSGFYVPLQLMIAEFDGGRNEKKRLITFRLLFLFIFGLMAAVAPKAFIDAFADPGPGFRQAGTGVALIIGISALLVYALSRESAGGPGIAERYAVFKNISSVFRDRMLASLALITAGGFAAVHVLEAGVLYYMKYWIRSEKDMPILFLAVIISSVGTMPLWNILSRRAGNKNVLRAGLVFWALSQLLWMALTPSSPAWSIIGVGAVAGIGYGCIHVLPQMMLAAVMDNNPAAGSDNAEATYPAIITMVTKIGNAVALLLTGLILFCAGFVPNDGMPDTARGAVSLTLSLLPIFFILIAFAGSVIIPSPAAARRG
jgi:glycoside/pentoside/hexuronide:cation symporter, GPH family